ncbi:sodium- and chloride-dependent glycine transporter 1-like [Elysia marginata]|uniref:Sodium- and chloride-dependent glycine transporter 1-like n=1 Tax=Elysia marginata TaxID=1093978 RepID=A0AAV4G789_9GAST|nr:sodium- and chloride-dependent glycine transporter 1-like [Elysia marginata]
MDTMLSCDHQVVYVAATIPYLILTCLLIRGCLLPGAGNGLYFYMVPTWDRLLSFQVWRNAASQVFYSIGMGFGLISTLASYNRFHNNCYRDAMILPVLDCVTSVFAGLIIFTFLGYMANITGKSVDQVAQEGPGLVFVAYPSVLSTLPLPQLWSVLFFSMLFFVGLDSQFMHVQGVCTALADCYPDQLLPRKTQVTLAICVISFLLGIPITAQGGFYVLNLIDWYIASFSVMFIVFLEVMVLAWIYGTDNLYDDISAMIGYRPNVIFKFAWKYFTPAFVIVLWLSGLFNFNSIGEEHAGYPPWADTLGILIGLLPIVPVPIKMVWTLMRDSGSFKTRLRRSLRPSPLWKPAVEEMDTDNNMDLLRNEETAFSKLR